MLQTPFLDANCGIPYTICNTYSCTVMRCLFATCLCASRDAVWHPAIAAAKNSRAMVAAQSVQLLFMCYTCTYHYDVMLDHSHPCTNVMHYIHTQPSLPRLLLVGFLMQREFCVILMYINITCYTRLRFRHATGWLTPRANLHSKPRAGDTRNRLFADRVNYSYVGA